MPGGAYHEEYPLRPELQITRTSLGAESGALTQGNVDIGHYRTHNAAAFPSPIHLGARGERTFIHKNLSALPGFTGPPSDASHFATTSQFSYQPTGDKLVATPRHGAVFKEKMERVDIFGNDMSKVSKRREQQAMSTTMAMGRETLAVRRHRSPRYVHGGAFRTSSKVPLDRNAVDPSNPPPDFSTTTSAAFEQVARMREVTSTSQSMGNTASSMGGSTTPRYELSLIHI